jgi:hypothetical protein
LGGVVTAPVALFIGSPRNEALSDRPLSAD